MTKILPHGNTSKTNSEKTSTHKNSEGNNTGQKSMKKRCTQIQ